MGREVLPVIPFSRVPVPDWTPIHVVHHAPREVYPPLVSQERDKTKSTTARSCTPVFSPHLGSTVGEGLGAHIDMPDSARQSEESPAQRQRHSYGWMGHPIGLDVKAKVPRRPLTRQPVVVQGMRPTHAGLKSLKRP